MLRSIGKQSREYVELVLKKHMHVQYRVPPTEELMASEMCLKGLFMNWLTDQ